MSGPTQIDAHIKEGILNHYEGGGVFSYTFGSGCGACSAEHFLWWLKETHGAHLTMRELAEPIGGCFCGPAGGQGWCESGGPRGAH